MYCLTSNTVTLVEHLKATKLVKKLEGNKHRGQQVVINHLVPYPAVTQQTPTGVRVRVLDFEGVVGEGETAETALHRAQDALLRHLMVALLNKSPIPAPDQFLEMIDEDEIIMLDPLRSQAAAVAHEGSHTFSQ